MYMCTKSIKSLLIFIISGADFVQVGHCLSIYQPLMEEIARANDLQDRTSIKWMEFGMAHSEQLVWDVVLCDVVSPQGTLRTGVFEELGFIRC